jgi:hypothetical protein
MCLTEKILVLDTLCSGMSDSVGGCELSANESKHHPTLRKKKKLSQIQTTTSNLCSFSASNPNSIIPLHR